MSKSIDIKQIRQDSITSNTKVILKSFGLPNNTRKEDISYAVFNLNNVGKVRKIGYSCPLMYIDYPIYLITNGKEVVVHIGKTGIYEIQFEELDNNLEINFDISDVYLPLDVDFIFNYELIIE